MSDQALSRRLREMREAETIPDPEPEPAQEEQPDSPPPSRRLLGERLIDKGALTREALDAALEEQRRDGRPLGEILLSAGAITPQNLARALTEQHGFDASGSLRERLATVEQSLAADAEAAPAETYLLLEPDQPEPRYVATTFLDAADVAFELIEDEEPEALEIVRARGGDREQLWSYEGETASSPLDASPFA